MEHELFRRRKLPHWDVPGAAYFVTVCLEGSIPAQGQLDIIRYRKELESRPQPPNQSADQWTTEKWKLQFARVDRWLDHEPANRALEDALLAQIVTNALFHFAGDRYDLIAFVVMPSHFHWIFQPTEKWVATLPKGPHSARERVMHSIKTFTANQCNRLLARRGTFWQQESYDHWIRDVDELERIILYIEGNPLKAGLIESPEDWRWSSACPSPRPAGIRLFSAQRAPST